MIRYQNIAARASIAAGTKYDVRVQVDGVKRHVGTLDTISAALAARLFFTVAQAVQIHNEDIESAPLTDTEYQEHVQHVAQLKTVLDAIAAQLPTTIALFNTLESLNSVGMRSMFAAEQTKQIGRVQKQTLSPERFAEIHYLVDHVAPHLQPEYALTVGVAEEEYKLYFDRLMHMGPPGETGVAHQAHREEHRGEQ